MADYEMLKKELLNFLEQNLPNDLRYHGLDHTKDVLKVSMELASVYDLTAEEIKLLSTAALFHDSGFVHTYQGHEAASCSIAKEMLPDFGYTEDQIELICDLIMATQVPQNPTTQLQQILCDADLDYLGRSDFLETGRRLFEEFKSRGIVSDERDWNRLQVRFLSAHNYHTDFSKKHRESLKQIHLEEVKEIVAGYED